MQMKAVLQLGWLSSPMFDGLAVLGTLRMIC